MATSRILTKIGLVLCVVSLILQLLGYLCPGLVYTIIYLHLIGAILGINITGFGKLTTRVSVWYGQVCVDADNLDSESCSISSDHDARFYGFKITTALSPLADIDWTLVKICLTLALYMGCLGTLLAVVSLCATRVSHRLLTAIAAASMIVSGSLVIPAAIEIGMSVYDAVQNVETLKASTGYELVTIKVPWAIILSGVGVLFAFACAVCLLLATCKEKRKKSLEISPDPSKFPFSGNNANEKDGDVIGGTNVNPVSIKDQRSSRIGLRDNKAIMFENAVMRDNVSRYSNDPNSLESQESLRAKSDITLVAGDAVSVKAESEAANNYYTITNKSVITREARTVNTYYSSLDTESIPAARLLPTENSKIHESDRRYKDIGAGDKIDYESTALQSSSRKHNHETGLGSSVVNERIHSQESGLSTGNKDSGWKRRIPVISVSPYENAERDVGPKTEHERKKRPLTKNEKFLIDISAIYGERLMHGVNEYGQVIVKSSTTDKRERNSATNITEREASVVSW